MVWTGLKTAQRRLLFSLCGRHEKEGVRNQRQARLWCKCNDSWTSQSHSLVFGVLSVISRRWSLLSTPPHFDMQRHSLPLPELFCRKEWRFSQPTSSCSWPQSHLLLPNRMLKIIEGLRCHLHTIIHFYKCIIMRLINRAVMMHHFLHFFLHSIWLNIQSISF